MRVRGWDGKEPGGRPNPRGTRPRTKERPRHDDAVAARVLTIDRGRFTVLVGEGGDERTVTAMRARELARSGLEAVAVGDRVDVVGDVSGAVDTLARVVRVRPRTSVLRRTADDTDPVERVIVANADQLLVVTAAADPEPNLRMVDRCLAAAFDAGMGAAIALTKADLGDPAPVIAAYEALDVAVLVLSRTIGEAGEHGVAAREDGVAAGEHGVAGLDAVLDWLGGRESVLVGPSGVGKSTLVNALVPGAGRATGIVNASTGQGRHTSSSAVALRLGPAAERGWVVDTPGVRSFGLAHLQPQRLLESFSDLEPGSALCPRGCTHDEPGCALDAWVADGNAGPAGPVRLASLRRLLRSRAGEEDPGAHPR